MTSTKFPHGVAAGGGASGATVCGAVYALRASFDPTSSSQVSLGTLPAGAIVTGIEGYGGSTGGSSPTLHIGTSDDEDGLANELRADINTSANAAGVAGVLMNTALATATEVFGKVGGSAATGGTSAVAVLFTLP